ncbi:MAG: ATP-binding cassette domain-containing protein [Candidatus Jordarchaeales archaeon]
MLPKVLVLDEPTANLDPKASEMLVDTLRKLRDKYDTTIILVEHRVDRFIEAADRVVVMDSGRIVEDGPPEVVVRKADVLEKLGIRVPEVVELCKAVGIPLNGGLDELRFLALERMRELREASFVNDCSSRGEEILRMEDVVLSYGGVFSLRVDFFSLCRGEVVAVIGGNGSGKTTLAKLIAGLVKPKKGSIKRAKGLRVGMVFQNFEVQLFRSSVFDEVAFQLTEKLDPNHVKRRVESVLAEMGLLSLIGRHPHSLSQGEKQRVVIASLIVDPPDILILDEPTTGQDGHHLKILEEAVKKMKMSGVATVVITHDLSFAARVAERAAVVSGGRIAMTGDIRDILYKIDELAGFTPPETVKLAREAGLRGIIKPGDFQGVFCSKDVRSSIVQWGY